MDTAGARTTVDGRGKTITTFVIQRAAEELGKLAASNSAPWEPASTCVAREDLIFDDLPLVEYFTSWP